MARATHGSVTPKKPRQKHHKLSQDEKTYRGITMYSFGATWTTVSQMEKRYGSRVRWIDCLPKGGHRTISLMVPVKWSKTAVLRWIDQLYPQIIRRAASYNDG